MVVVVYVLKWSEGTLSLEWRLLSEYRMLGEDNILRKEAPGCNSLRGHVTLMPGQGLPQFAFKSVCIICLPVPSLSFVSFPVSL